jgi:ketosteroid isomerase-like protein
MTILALAAALLSSSAAWAAQDTTQDAQVLAPIKAALDAAQTGDIKTMQAQYLPGCTFVDEFAPFLWQGKGSMQAYFTSAAEMYKETGMSGTKVTRGTPKYAYVSGMSAYVVIPLDVTAQAKGKPYHATGSLVFTLQKTAADWKIATQTWTKDTESLDPY